MAITVHLPPEIEDQLRSGSSDPELRLLEAYAVDAYRRGELSRFQVSQLLGLSDRWETIRFLSERGVYPDYDLEDLEQDHTACERSVQAGKLPR